MNNNSKSWSYFQEVFLFWNRVHSLLSFDIKMLFWDSNSQLQSLLCSDSAYSVWCCSIQETDVISHSAVRMFSLIKCLDASLCCLTFCIAVTLWSLFSSDTELKQIWNTCQIFYVCLTLLFLLCFSDFLLVITHKLLSDEDLLISWVAVLSFLWSSMSVSQSFMIELTVSEICSIRNFAHDWSWLISRLIWFLNLFYLCFSTQNHWHNIFSTHI